jgi:GPH family glycoside/pentoside/hexuronide:cation symporter
MSASTVPASPLPSTPTTLPLPARLLYSLSSLGSEAFGRSRAIWLLFFYAPPPESGLPQLLPLALVGVLLSILGVLGSLDDTLIGYWSDRTKSRLGRRLPFILVGTPLAALFAVLVVTPPANASTATIAIFLFATMAMFNIFTTVSGGPYEALMPELARTSRDRVDLMTMRMFFSLAGVTIGLVVAGPLVDAFGLQAMMIIMVALAFGTRALGVLGVWRHVDRDQPPAEMSMGQALLTTLRNRQFLAFLPTFVLFQVGLAIILGVLPYYVTAVLGPESVGLWTSVLSGVAILAMLVAAPFVRSYAHHRSKREAYRLTMLVAGCAFPLLFFAGFVPGIPALPQVLLVMALCGAPLVGIYIFPHALTADIVDYDAVQTGMRREAIYFGMQGFVERTTTSVSPLILAGLLSLGATAANPIGVRLVGPVAGLFMLASVFLFRLYTLPDEILPAPGQAESATDSGGVAPVAAQLTAASGGGGS